MNVIMIFEMIGEVLAWYLEKYDVGGFKQSIEYINCNLYII